MPDGNDAIALTRNPRLRPVEVDYDARWIGWDETDKEVEAGAIRAGLVVRAPNGDLHLAPGLAPAEEKSDQ